MLVTAWTQHDKSLNLNTSPWWSNDWELPSLVNISKNAHKTAQLISN